MNKIFMGDTLITDTGLEGEIIELEDNIIGTDIGIRYNIKLGIIMRNTIITREDGVKEFVKMIKDNAMYTYEGNVYAPRHIIKIEHTFDKLKDDSYTIKNKKENIRIGNKVLTQFGVETIIEMSDNKIHTNKGNSYKIDENRILVGELIIPPNGGKKEIVERVEDDLIYTTDGNEYNKNDIKTVKRIQVNFSVKNLLNKREK